MWDLCALFIHESPFIPGRAQVRHLFIYLSNLAFEMGFFCLDLQLGILKRFAKFLHALKIHLFSVCLI